MILYHWTPKYNRRSILSRGLIAGYALGLKKTVWACNAKVLGWAMAHIAARHGIKPDDLILIRIDAPKSRIRRTPFRGVYTADAGYEPERLTFLGGIADAVT